jgi:hypothetical protein
MIKLPDRFRSSPLRGVSSRRSGLGDDNQIQTSQRWELDRPILTGAKQTGFTLPMATSSRMRTGSSYMPAGGAWSGRLGACPGFTIVVPTSPSPTGVNAGAGFEPQTACAAVTQIANAQDWQLIVDTTD